MADKNFYINSDRATRVDATGAADATVASLYYQEVPNWTLQFIDSANAQVDLSSVVTWASAVDDDFDGGSEPWVRVLDADIDSSLAATGIITIPVDSNTATFLAGIGTSEYAAVWFELRGLDVSGNIVTYVRFAVLAKNTLDPSGGTPPAPTGNYYTKTETNALLAGKLDKNQFIAATDFKVAQENTVYTVPAGKLFKPDMGDIVTTAITGAATPPTYKWLADATDLMTALVATMNAVGEYESDNVNAQKYWPAGTVFKLEVTSAGTSTTHTGQSILTGVLIDA